MNESNPMSWGQLFGVIHESFSTVSLLFYALLIFMVLDYITGILVAIMQRRINSKIGFTGILKKVFIVVIFIMGLTIDTFIIGQGQAVTVVITSFYLGNEGFSVLENAERMKIPLPQKLLAVLEQMQNKE